MAARSVYRAEVDMKRAAIALAVFSTVLAMTSSVSIAAPAKGEALACKRNGAVCQTSSECCGGWCVSTKNSSSRLVCSSHS